MVRKIQKQRKLWMRLRAKTPPGVTPNDVKRTLIASIERGDYTYPDNWYVQILWRNREDVPMKEGEFTYEMNKSAQSSDGWDRVVLNYLYGK
jgi:hypothetical protein